MVIHVPGYWSSLQDLGFKSARDAITIPMTPMDENGETRHYVVSRKRRSSSVDPLRPVNTSQSARRQSSRIDKSTDVSAVDEDMHGPYERYCAYFKSIASKEMYETVYTDVLSKVSVESSVETLDALVTTYLETGEFVEPVRAGKRKRRCTAADQKIIDGGLDFTPSPPATQSRRRSKRLRNSLSVYRQGAASSASTVPETESQDVPPETTTEISPVCQLDVTFTVVESSSSEDDIPEHIIELYKSRGPSVMPQPKAFSTVYETVHKHRGSEVIFSKKESLRMFDFSEGYWYNPPLSKQRQRARKAKQNGWKPCTNKKRLAEINKAVEKLLAENETSE